MQPEVPIIKPQKWEVGGCKLSLHKPSSDEWDGRTLSKDRVLSEHLVSKRPCQASTLGECLFLSVGLQFQIRLPKVVSQCNDSSS